MHFAKLHHEEQSNNNNNVIFYFKNKVKPFCLFFDCFMVYTFDFHQKEKATLENKKASKIAEMCNTIIN